MSVGEERLANPGPEQPKHRLLDLTERSGFPLPLSSLKEEVETKALFFLSWQHFRMVSLSCTVTHSICKVRPQEPRKAVSEKNRPWVDSPTKCRSGGPGDRPAAALRSELRGRPSRAAPAPTRSTGTWHPRAPRGPPSRIRGRTATGPTCFSEARPLPE